MAKVTIDIEQLKKLVAEYNHKVAANIVTPPSLDADVELWNAYPKTKTLALRQTDIDTTMDAIVRHLETLAVPADCSSSFKLAGDLRQNIKAHAAEDLLPLFMRQLLDYITLISVQPDADRTTYLMKFPPREVMEFKCLLGTMERMDGVVQELQMQSLPPEEKAVLEAHFTVVERGRRLCASEISDGNQPHVASAIAYLAGFDDPTKMGPAIAYDIRASTAWTIYRDHVKQVNAELKQRREEHIAKLTALVTMETPDYSKIVRMSEELTFNLGEVCDASDAENICYQPAKIPDLFPEIELSSPLSIEFDLFDHDAPEHIALLFCSEEPAQQAAAFRALRLIGHHEQLGGSVIQFLRTFHEIGILRNKLPAEALNEGLRFFTGLKDTPPFSKDVDVLTVSLAHYIQDPDEDDVYASNYILYLMGADTLPSVGELVDGRAPLELIHDKLHYISSNDMFNFFSGINYHLTAFSFRPDADMVLCCLAAKARELLSPEQYLHCAEPMRLLGPALVYNAARFNYPKIIECVENNFNATKPTDIESYKNGLKLLAQGLFTIQAPNITYNGAGFLAIRDVKFLVEKLRSIITVLGVNPVPMLKIYNAYVLPILYTLASEGHLYGLRHLLEIVEPQGQKALIYNDEPKGRMPIQAAIKGGHLATLNYFLALKSEDNITPIMNLKDDNALALRLMWTAVDTDQVEALKSLIAAGADITLSQDGASLLHRAAQAGRAKIIKYLTGLEREGTHLVAVDAKNKDDQTALMLAVSGRKKSAIEALVVAGANVSEGKSLFEFVIDTGQEAIIPFLLSLKGPSEKALIDVNGLGIDGNTPILMLMKKQSSITCERFIEIAKVFLLAGADSTPIGHQLLVDSLYPVIAHAVLGAISSEQLLAMLNFKNSTGLSAMQRFVVKIGSAGDQTLLNAVLSKLKQPERLNMLMLQSSEEKNTLAYADASIRALLCEGLTEAEIKSLEPKPSTDSSEEAASEPKTKRKAKDSAIEGGERSAVSSHTRSHSQSLQAGLGMFAAAPVGSKRKRAADSAGATALPGSSGK